MTIENGSYEPITSEELEDILLARAQQQFDKEINTGEYSMFRLLYRPVAQAIVALQEDISDVLESAQIDNATGEALDLLVALVGVFRKEAEYATGEVVFSRSTPAAEDYSIPQGTTVQTSTTIDRIQFETTEYGEISTNESQTTVPVKAKIAGAENNVAANTVTVLATEPTGIQSVNNPQNISGGFDRETDVELRERAKEELSKGSRATAGAIVTAVSDLSGTASPKIFPNYEYTLAGTDVPGFELVVAGGDNQEIADAILDTKAAGDKTYAGYKGGSSVTETSTLDNGQSQTVKFSRPGIVDVTIDATIDVTDSFSDDGEIKANIVDYIGGTKQNGRTVDGELSIGDDVIKGEIEYAIRRVDGVYDIDSLTITTPSSTGGNAGIADSELSDVDLSNITLTINNV